MKIRLNVAVASRYRVGNCEEQASLAFDFLEKLNVRPLDYMVLGDCDHGFVVIGRTGDAAQPDLWGDEACVCDPWANDDPYPLKGDSRWEAYPYRPARWV